jgi:hypothetical protein
MPSAAVAERRAMQQIQSNTPNPNLVSDQDGYRTLFGKGGEVIGTTRPVQTGMDEVDQGLFNKGQGTNAERAQLNAGLQQAGQTALSRSSGMDQIFGGGAKQPSPSGVASRGPVEPQMPQGAPGGELFGQMPEFKSAGMAMPKLPDDRPNVASAQARASLMSRMNSGGPQYKMKPNEGPMQMADFGPQLPYSSPEQIQALRRLQGFAGDMNPTLAALEMQWNNIYPGVKDFDYLRQLFPGLVHPQSGAGGLMTELAKMYQSPAYQSQFDREQIPVMYK